jgi:hypothetical protein
MTNISKLEMSKSNNPSIEEIISLVAELVPDVPVPSDLFAEIKAKDSILWIEGWCDGCIAGEGFPHKGEGMLQEKLDHIRNVTPGFLEKRAIERGMVVQYSGFIPLDNKEFLYGVSWAIFRKQE